MRFKGQNVTLKYKNPFPMDRVNAKKVALL